MFSGKKTADIVIAFHASSNVNKKLFKKRLLKFIVNLVKKSSTDNGNVRIGLTSFGKTFQPVFNLGQYSKKKDLKKAIKKAPLSYKSDDVKLADALRNIRTQMFVPPQDRTGIKNYLVIISDSPDQSDMNDLRLEKNGLGDTIIHGISIGEKDENLRSVVNDPHKKFYQVFKQYDDLAKFKKSGKKVLKNIKSCK